MNNKKFINIVFVLILAITICFGGIITYADEYDGEQLLANEDTVSETVAESEQNLTEEDSDIFAQTDDSFDILSETLDVPKLVSAKSVSNGIKITWKAVDNAKLYYVYRKSGNGSWIKIAESKKNRYTDYTCDYAVLYRYTVRAVSTKGTLSGYVKNGITGVFVPAVSVKSLKNNQSDITVKWGKVACANGYKVYRREQGAKKWTLIATTASVSYKDTSKLSYGKVYEYNVKAYSVVNKKKYSSICLDTGVLKTTRMSVPKVKAKSAVKGTTISWNAVKGAVKYYVFLKAGSRWAQIGTTKKNKFVFKDAPAGIAETYTVVAEDKYGNYSSYKKNGVSAAYIQTTQITTIKNVMNKDNKTEYVSIKWTKAEGATGYRVYRKTKNGSWKIIATTSKTSFNDKTAKKSGKNYIYAIRPMMSVGSKVYLSAYVSANNKTIMWLNTPVLKKVYCVNNSIKIIWQAVEGAKEYYVYRKTSGTSFSYCGKTTKESYADKNVTAGTRYYYTVKAVGSTGNRSGYMKAKLSDVYYPTNDYRYYKLPDKRYLNLGWNVDPRDSWGPADYCKSPTTYHGTLMTNSNWWVYHDTYHGDKYKPQPGDIITYGVPDSNGDTYEHVDICVSGYDSATGKFGVISGNWGSDFRTSPIAYTEKDWSYYTYKYNSGSVRICNIWQCKLSSAKKTALVNTAWGMEKAYEKNPDKTRNLILSCKYNNWCDVFVSYVIYVAK